MSETRWEEVVPIALILLGAAAAAAAKPREEVEELKPAETPTKEEIEEEVTPVEKLVEETPPPQPPPTPEEPHVEEETQRLIMALTPPEEPLCADVFIAAYLGGYSTYSGTLCGLVRVDADAEWVSGVVYVNITLKNLMGYPLKVELRKLRNNAVAETKTVALAPYATSRTTMVLHEGEEIRAWVWRS